MNVKEKLLRQLLDDYVMSGAELARDMEVAVTEVEKMLNGEKVGCETTRKFLAYFGPDEAFRLIDCSAGIKNLSGKNGGNGGL